MPVAILQHNRFAPQMQPTCGYEVDWGHPLSVGLIAGWLFNEGGGRRVQNVVPEGLPGIFTANDSVTFPTWTRFTKYGGYALTSGGQSYIGVGLGSKLEPTRITVQCWMKPASSSQNHIAMSKRHLGNGDNAWFLGKGDATGTFKWIAYTSAGTLNCRSATNFSTGVWHHGIGIYDGANANLWVDKVNTATAAGSGTLNGASARRLVIASDDQISNYWDGGDLALPMIWGRPLTPNEIAWLFHEPYAFLRPINPYHRVYIALSGTAYSQLLTETLTLTDALLRESRKLLSEGVTLTDVLAKLTNKPFTEGVTLNEVLSKQPQKMLLEALTATDALARSTTKALSDPVALTDAVMKSTGKTFTEVVILTDTLLKQLIFVKVLTETITLTETLTKQAGKTLVDTVTLTEVLTKSLQRVLAEAVTLSEVLVKHCQKALADSVTLNDLVLKQAQKTLAEAATLTDSLTKDAAKLLSESVVLTDVVNKRTTKTLTELLIATETVAKTIQKLLNEQATVSDSLVATLITVARGYVQAVKKALTDLSASSTSMTQPGGSGGSAQP